MHGDVVQLIIIYLSDTIHAVRPGAMCQILHTVQQAAMWPQWKLYSDHPQSSKLCFGSKTLMKIISWSMFMKSFSLLRAFRDDWVQNHMLKTQGLSQGLQLHPKINVVHEEYKESSTRTGCTKLENNYTVTKQKKTHCSFALRSLF